MAKYQFIGEVVGSDGQEIYKDALTGKKQNKRDVRSDDEVQYLPSDSMSPVEQENRIKAGRQAMKEAYPPKKKKNVAAVRPVSSRASSGRKMMAQATGKRAIAPPSVLPTRKA